MFRVAAIVLSSFLLCIACLMALVSCNRDNPCYEEQKQISNWMESNGKLKVLSTTAMIDDIVADIGGEYVDSISLIKGDLNPHSYQLVKGDDEKLAFADLIFFNGLGLEHGASLHHYLTTAEKAVPLGDKVFKEAPDEVIFVNGQVDPHIWMDVSLWMKTIPVIVQELSLKDPTHREYYLKNGERLTKELADTHHDIQELLQSIPSEKRFLVTSHDAFNYFTRRYLADSEEKTIEDWQKRFMAPEGLSPEGQLSPHEIRNLISHLSKYHIKVLFPESNVSKDSIKKILSAGKEEGLTLTISPHFLYADAMGRPGTGGDTYQKMMMHNAITISQNLQ